MKNLSLDSIIVRNNDIVFSDIDGDVIMMSIQKGKYYSMEEIGSRIWELIKDDMEVSTLCKVLCEEYNIEKEQCKIDVLKFLNDLAEENLIHVRQ